MEKVGLAILDDEAAKSAAEVRRGHNAAARARARRFQIENSRNADVLPIMVNEMVVVGLEVDLMAVCREFGWLGANVGEEKREWNEEMGDFEKGRNGQFWMFF